MIDLDEKIDLATAAQFVPRNSRSHKNANCAQIARWCRDGVSVLNGERVFLEHWQFGRKIFTSLRAINEFGRAVAEARRNRVRTRKSAVSRRVADAVDELTAAGV